MLGFLAAAWVSVVSILVAAPDVYDRTLRTSIRFRRPAEFIFLAVPSVFLLVLATGVLRCWRWTFWLILKAFLLGVVRVPATVLQLIGTQPAFYPAWYLLFQAIVGVIQFGIGLVMLAGYRRGGAWA